MIGWALILAALAPAGAADVPLAPSGVWSVTFAEGMCVLARPYGTDGAYSLGIRRTPLADSSKMLITERGGGKTNGEGAVTVTFLPSGKTAKGAYITAWLSERDFRLSTFSLNSADLEPLRTSTAMTVELAGRKSISFSLATVGGGLSALHGCEDAVLRQWQIDPAERALIDTPADRKNRFIVGFESYPADAMRAGEQGAAAVAWLVDAKGVGRDCRVVASSGSRSLDAASCMLALRGAKFTPAIGKDGKPMASHMTTRVNWALPGAKLPK